MKKYRIKKQEGKYYPQRRFILWYHDIHICVNNSVYTISFPTKEQAELYIIKKLNDL